MTIDPVSGVIDYGLGAAESTTGGACTVPETLLSSGTYQDTSGRWCTIYPLDYPTVWPEQHHHHHYPWYPTTMPLMTGVSSTPERTSAEKPHEVVQRALREIAAATRALRDGAAALGVPVDAVALEEAIVAKLRAALC